jgi:triacylglycerol lipase
MKKLKSKIFLFLVASLLTTSVAASGSSTKPLQGSYPIVLSHGILGFDDTNGLLNGLVKYWGGMDDYLRSQGASVLTPGTTAMQSVEYRANQQRTLVLNWMAANNYSKVHVIGHSQGGLVSRYMVANLGMAGKTSTLTTLNSVHRGTPTADIGLAVIPSWLQPLVGTVVNTFSKLIYGGGEQDVIKMAQSLTTTTLATFNQTTPNAAGVKYFSYGSKITIPDLIQHPLMGITYPITWTGGLFNGQGADNDGVVPITSQEWGTWKGGPSYGLLTTGVDHLQATNFEWTGQTWYDVEGYFLSMATNAKSNQ